MKRNARLLSLVFLALVAAGLAWGGRYAWDRWVAIPILDYLATVDLGEREYGEIAVGRFTIANRGRSELLLTDFFTSCSCAGVEREVDGQFQRLESVLIPPGEQVELVVRVSVSLQPGERQLVQVVFSSNDPARPSGQVEVVVPYVKGGAFAEPGAVLFGEIRVGRAARQVIELYDNRHAGRRIGKVRSLDTDRLEVRLLPLDPQETEQVHERGGRLIARLEVLGETSRTGPLNGRIEVSLAGETRRPDVILVFGEVVRDVECRPSTLILPRRAGERWLFSGQVLLRHRDGRAIRVQVENASPGISAKVRPVPESDDRCWLEVEWTGSQPALSGEQRIRLRVHTDEYESRFEMPVLLTTEPSSPVPRAETGS